MHGRQEHTNQKSKQTETLTDPLRPGKLKNTSGPFRCGI